MYVETIEADEEAWLGLPVWFYLVMYASYLCDEKETNLGEERELTTWL